MKNLYMQYNITFIPEIPEIWLPILELPSHFEVSNYGRIRGIERSCNTRWGDNRPVPSRILLPKEDKNGYLYLGLRHEGNRIWRRIHRLVAEAFIPNPENKSFVNHLKGDKKDNRAWMIEWSTQSENEKHAYRIGLKDPQKTMLGRKGKSCPASRGLQQFGLDGNLIAKYECAYEAKEKTGIDNSDIGKCAKGRLNHAGGFIWKYIE